MFFPFFLSAFERQGRNKGNLHRGLLRTKKNDGISNGKMFLYAELCRRGRKKKQDAETSLSMARACFFLGGGERRNDKRSAGTIRKRPFGYRTESFGEGIKRKNPGKTRGFVGSEGRIRTNDTRIMIPLL
jgi:hypothetical protein